MTIDPRIDGNVKTAPLWAKALLVMLAKLLGPEKTREAIDDLDGANEQDYTVTLHGRPLVAWLGINRKTMVDLGLNQSQIDEIKSALAHRGRDVSHLDEIAVPIKALPGDNEIILPTDNEEKKDAGKPPHEPKKVAGRFVRDLAGKSYDELLQIDGIGPAKAKWLSELKPDTEE